MLSGQFARQPCGHICSWLAWEETEIICGGGAYLDQILALSLGDERLKLGRGEGVNQARLRHDQQQNLGACQDGQFVRLQNGEISWLAGSSSRMERKASKDGDSHLDRDPRARSASHIL